MASLKVGAVLLCAGTSTRFNGNKLLYDFWGEPLIRRYSRIFPKDGFFDTVAVVSNPAVQDILNECGYKSVWNPSPQSGQSCSIKLGLLALKKIDACMFSVCDQPFLSPNTIRGMTQDYKSGALSLSYKSQPASPVIMPKECFGELMNLSQDETGRDAIKNTGVKLNFYNAECAIELRDADRLSDMKELKNTKNIFLTGSKDIGKSTILFEALYDAGVQTTGFLTLPIGNKHSNDGYFFHGFKGTITESLNDMPISEYKYGTRVVVISTFETQGVECLKNSLRQNKFIIMDELGTLEETAEAFKSQVKTCLDSDTPVFGVLRDEQSPFLSEIKDRTDTRVIRVSQKGDKYAYDELLRTALHIKDNSFKKG